MFRHFIELGGPLMWPLLVCSILLVAVLIERLLVIGLGHRVLDLRLGDRTLGWHRRALPFFTDVPPSVGLLGTVVGVVQSFHLMNGQLDVDSVGAGLGVACMTTIFGLSIAIVATVAMYLLDWAVGWPLVAERRVA